MKLTKKEAQKIADNYDLGMVKSLNLIKKGLVNHNYILKSEKGDFIIRILGHEFDDWKKKLK